MSFPFRSTSLLAVLLLCVAAPPFSTAQISAGAASAGSLPITSPNTAARSGASIDSTDTGFLAVRLRSSVDSLYVVIDGRYDRARRVANGDTLALPAGERDITIATSRTWDVTTSANIVADSTQLARLQVLDEKDREEYLENSSYPVLKTGANLQVETDPDAAVLVNGAVKGQGSTQLRLPAGRYVVTTHHPVAGEKEERVTVRDDPPRLVDLVMYTKASRKRARRLSLVPGLGQLHKNDTARGLIVLSGFTIAAAGGLQQHVSYASANSEYEDARLSYENATTEEEALRFGNLAEQQYDAARSAYRGRNVLVGLATGLYLYSLLDAWLTTPDAGYRSPTMNSPSVRPFFGTNGQTGVTLSLSF